MTVLSPLRRLGLTVVAVAASATLVTACGSSTSGNPIKLDSNTSAASVPATSGGGSSVSVGGGATSASAPVATTSSVNVGGGGGSGSDAAFCAEIKSFATDISGSLSGGTSGLKPLAAKYQKLADDAPAAIKPDVQKLADYLKSLADGKVPDATTATDLSTVAQHLGSYLASHCVS